MNHIVGILACCVPLVLPMVAGAGVRVDFGSVVGPVKPVNGIGQPPVVGWGNCGMFHYLKEAGIPYSRLHDVGGAFGKNIFVDIPNLFRDFDADENDPKNYDFAFTDILLKGLVENGVEPYFRLGVTIENRADIRPYRILPPKDYAKWARICEHVIRHYTEGWADGYRMKITHWEIWNEPDGYEKPADNRMFMAPFAEYCRFYETASKHLKAKFPHLKIGGYASCGFYDITKTRHHVQNTGRYGHLAKCFRDFVDYVKAHGCPWDFFSFHCYDDPANAVKQNQYVRDYLDAHGFKSVELSLNEWMPFTWTDRNDSARKTASIAAMLAVMQNGPIDDAEIYDAKCGAGQYSPMFSSETSGPRPVYWVYYAFNELRLLKNAVRADCSIPDVYVVAADDGNGTGAIFLVSTARATVPVSFDFQGREVVSCRVTDATRVYAEAELPDMLPSDSVWRIVVKSPDASRARPDLVAKVNAGELGYVRASWYGFDAEDSTKALQAALDSRARKVIIDRMPSGAWPTRPLRCGSDKEIVFENGAEICAKKGAFRGATDTMIVLSDASHVAIRGRGTIRMRRGDYLQPPYSKAEWRNGISLYGVRDFTLEDVTVVETGGDGLYVGCSRKTGAPCCKVKVRNCVFDRNTRQGVSVISVDGLLMENCTLSNTKGLPPEAGIDFEPNLPSEVLKRCVLRNCSFDDNHGCGFAVYLATLNAQSEPIDIRLENCSFSGNRRSFSYSLGGAASAFPFADGIVTAENCVFKGGREGAIYVGRRKFSTGETVFRNCTVVDACTASPTNAEVVVRVLGMNGAGPDGVRFENMRIVQPVKRDWLAVRGENEYVGAPTVISGDVTVAGPGDARTETFDAARYRRDFPYRPARPLPAYRPFDFANATVVDAKPGEIVPLSPICVRGGIRSAFVFYVDAPRTVRFRGVQRRIGKRQPTRWPVTISSVDGNKPLASVAMPDFGEFDFTFAAPAAGFYKMGVNTAGNGFGLAAADVPVALDVQQDCARLVGAVGTLYVPVPAQTEVSVFAAGESDAERVGVVLADASGREVAADRAIGRAVRLLWPGEKAFRVRALELVKPTRGVSEDAALGVSGVPGFLFLSPERHWK